MSENPYDAALPKTCDRIYVMIVSRRNFQADISYRLYVCEAIF